MSRRTVQVSCKITIATSFVVDRATSAHEALIVRSIVDLTHQRDLVDGSALACSAAIKCACSLQKRVGDRVGAEAIRAGIMRLCTLVCIGVALTHRLEGLCDHASETGRWLHESHRAAAT
jgi:hypothetical protein